MFSDNNNLTSFMKYFKNMYLPTYNYALNPAGRSTDTLVIEHMVVCLLKANLLALIDTMTSNELGLQL